MSLLELNERAQGRIDEIRRANALKSQQKIKELTAEHQKVKGAKKPAPAVDQDVIMDDESEEETKEERKDVKKNGKRRDPLEGSAGKHPSKNLVAKSKLANKRSQKEAIKKIKMKRDKGTVKEVTERPKSAKTASKAD